MESLKNKMKDVADAECDEPGEAQRLSEWWRLCADHQDPMSQVFHKQTLYFTDGCFISTVWSERVWKVLLTGEPSQLDHQDQSESVWSDGSSGDTDGSARTSALS